MITSLTTHFTTIAVGDCRDGVLFYAYHEVSIMGFCQSFVLSLSLSFHIRLALEVTCDLYF